MTLIDDWELAPMDSEDEVSILVFLDDAHRRSWSATARRSDRWFQSLFSWMTLIDVVVLDDWGLLEVFQSLFSWMTLIDAGGPGPCH